MNLCVKYISKFNYDMDLRNIGKEWDNIFSGWFVNFDSTTTKPFIRERKFCLNKVKYSGNVSKYNWCVYFGIYLDLDLSKVGWNVVCRTGRYVNDFRLYKTMLKYFKCNKWLGDHFIVKNIKIIRYLFNLDLCCIDDYKYNNYNSFSHANYLSVKFLSYLFYNVGLDVIDFGFKNNFLITWSCKNGVVKVVKFLIEKVDIDLSDCDDYVNYYNGYGDVDMKGHMKVVDYLFGNISHYNEKWFDTCCNVVAYGHWVIVIYLYEIVELELKYFEEACYDLFLKCGNRFDVNNRVSLDMVKYLYEIVGVDICNFSEFWNNRDKFYGNGNYEIDSIVEYLIDIGIEKYVE